MLNRLFIVLGMLLVASAADGADSPTPDAQLAAQLTPLVERHAGDVAVAVRNLTTGDWFAIHAQTPMPTASLIKLPLLIPVYQAQDQGQLDLNQAVTLRAEDKVPGSGVLTDHLSVGVQLPLRDYLRLMIRFSDNTATNIVVDAVGLKSVAEAMESLGFPQTKMHSKVYRGDTTIFPARSKQYGIGSTTAEEMVRLLQKLHADELASQTSTQAILDHLLACEDDSKLAKRLPSTVKIAHKTGAIANCRTDAGILYCEQGPVAVCVLTNNNEDQRWSDDNAADQLCAEIGQLVAERFGSPGGSTDLREGSFGKLVETLQRTLNARLEPSPALAIDGDFGPATRSAVERFQRAHDLPATGIVQRETWQAMGSLIEYDEPIDDPQVINRQVLPRQPQPGWDEPPIVTCKAWLVGNRSSGEVLYESDSDMPLPPASTTKIMTAHLVIQLAEQDPDLLEETVTFSQRADTTVGSTSGLRAGEQVSVGELLYGLLLPSGNDAAVALAEHCGHRVERATTEAAFDDDPYLRFLQKMNEQAQQLGLQQTHYENPHGLTHPLHLSSARDLFRLATAAMKHSLFRDIVATRQYGCVATSEQGYRRNVLWKNTNQLLPIEGYRGVKTGTTTAAGACLISCGERKGDELMLVVLGSSSSPARYADTRNLFRWAWRQRLTSQ